MEWTDMVHYQQQMQKIMRSLLPEHKSGLTVSECELLAHLYLRPEQNTPVLLSQGSGMKKKRSAAASNRSMKKTAFPSRKAPPTSEATSCLSPKPD